MFLRRNVPGELRLVQLENAVAISARAGSREDTSVNQSEAPARRVELGVRRRAVLQHRDEHDSLPQGGKEPRGLGTGVHNDSSHRSADRGPGRVFEIRGE